MARLDSRHCKMAVVGPGTATLWRRDLLLPRRGRGLTPSSSGSLGGSLVANRGSGGCSAWKLLAREEREIDRRALCCIVSAPPFPLPLPRLDTPASLRRLQRQPAAAG